MTDNQQEQVEKVISSAKMPKSKKELQLIIFNCISAYEEEISDEYEKSIKELMNMEV